MKEIKLSESGLIYDNSTTIKTNITDIKEKIKKEIIDLEYWKDGYYIPKSYVDEVLRIVDENL